MLDDEHAMKGELRFSGPEHVRPFFPETIAFDSLTALPLTLGREGENVCHERILQRSPARWASL